MVNMTFIGQSVPGIRRKLQRLDGALGMNPSQLVDIVFKVYNTQETRKLRQATIFLEIVLENQKRWNLQGKGKDPLGANQCAYCKEEDHWRRECLKFERRNKEYKNLHREMLERTGEFDDEWGGQGLP